MDSILLNMALGVNSNKTKQSNIVTPRKKDTPTHKITRLCMIPKEVLKARCSLYFKKSYDNIPVKKTQLRFYIPNSRNRNHQSKTAVASIVPANYSVDAVMKDLLQKLLLKSKKKRRSIKCCS